ncbi:arogenate dehydratase/prephenate dehydratase 1, chloroplastic-like [Vigna umbellata]|uniref:arogenate dehydratase/prephenate dehydratase 1, chloroplastic-like n=1 Tax=Vigna umbellata TaxID=87088 RepID=UPI001F5EF449|nr:arogenate dehydratase/prephenate dehydratase 1, chloroplastic-like [Vigna umbellata]
MPTSSSKTTVTSIFLSVLTSSVFPSDFALEMLMALIDGCTWGCAKAPRLGLANFHPACSRLSVNLKEGAEKWCKRKCCCLRVSAPKALIPMEDEKAAVTGFESSGNADRIRVQSSVLLEGFHKDAKLINKQLRANGFCSSDRSKVRVAYKGLPGAYNEDAAFKAYPNCETVPCLDSETAFKSVESWLVDKAVLPIESCIAGSIHRNYDLLIRHKLHIVGELHLLIKHCLLGLKAVKKEDLTSVMSHPQALLQCETMLTDLGVTNIAVDDTAAAARAVALEGRRDIGAIASSRAAELYGLDILAEGIQDDEANVTRFLILARDPIIPGNDRPYKTSIVFSLDEDPTVLFRALGAFALRNINLSKIESRPLKHCPLSAVDDSKEGSAKSFKYLLYIDFEASLADPRARNALENLQECTRYFRILGCYPVDDETDTTGSS